MQGLWLCLVIEMRLLVLLLMSPPLLLLMLTARLSSLLAMQLSRLHLYAAAPLCNFISTFAPDLARLPDALIH
jgi:hypothetical protein